MNNVLLLRQMSGLTQDEFAERCNVARISIARYEAGAEVSRANARKIADACGVSISYVVGEQKAPYSGTLLESSLIEMLISLSPSEVQRVRDFVAGMKAGNKA